MNWKHYVFLAFTGIGAAATALATADPAHLAIYQGVSEVSRAVMAVFGLMSGQVLGLPKGPPSSPKA